mmetsp:Transcript_69955/g.130779  ORF Transcript_69955/g.130779 Transcript_69955/m.130779 type:complete len:465 (-) Transcript_69955:21-1415(-)
MRKLWSVVTIAGLVRCAAVFAGLSSSTEHNVSALSGDASPERGSATDVPLPSTGKGYASALMEASGGAVHSMVLTAPKEVHDLLLASAHRIDSLGHAFAEQWGLHAALSQSLDPTAIQSLLSLSGDNATDDNSTAVEMVLAGPFIALLLRFFFLLMALVTCSLIYFIGSVVFTVIYYCTVTSMRRSIEERVLQQLGPGADKKVAAEFKTIGGLQADPNSDFHEGLFGCCQDVHYLAHGLCCATVRASDTLSAAGLMGFWCAMIYYVLMSFFCCYGEILILNGWAERGYERICGGLCLYALVMLWRMNFRRKLRHTYGGLPNWRLSDTCIVLCCWQCAVVQEARFVDKQEHTKVRCCCRMRELQISLNEVLVGDPVRANKETAAAAGDENAGGAVGATSTTTGEESAVVSGSGASQQAGNGDPVLFSGAVKSPNSDTIGDGNSPGNAQMPDSSVAAPSTDVSANG